MPFTPTGFPRPPSQGKHELSTQVFVQPLRAHVLGVGRGVAPTGPGTRGERPRQAKSSPVSPRLSRTAAKIPRRQRRDPSSPPFDYSSRRQKTSKKQRLTPGRAFSQPGCKLGRAGAAGWRGWDQVGEAVWDPLDAGAGNFLYMGLSDKPDAKKTSVIRGEKKIYLSLRGV